MIGLSCLSVAVAQAQPKARRQQQQQQTQTSNRNNMTLRAQISFPTEQKMDEDVVWRRDVYREARPQR